MPTFSTLELAVLCLSSVCIALLMLVSLLSSYVWFKVADSFWMKPRWCKWQIVSLSITWFCFLGTRCTTMWRSIWMIRTPHSVGGSLRGIAYWVFVTAVLITMLVWLVLFYARLWLAFFDAKLCMELALLEWKQMIDTREHSDDVNWFVARQNTWGNPSYVLKVITPLTVLLLACVAFVIFWADDYVYIFYVLIVISFVAVWALFAKKYPAFRDRIHLREEANCVKWGLSVYAVIAVIGALAYALVEAKEDSVAWVLTVCIRQIASGIMCVGFQLAVVNYVTSFFLESTLTICGIPLLFDLDSEELSECDLKWSDTNSSAAASRRRNECDSTAALRPTYSAVKQMESRVTLKVSLFHVLRHDIGCRLLMSHLLSELSQENLLALIECVKFRERMAAVCGVQLKDDDKVRAANLFGTEVNAMQSSIVAALQSPADAPQVYDALCNKYVLDTSANGLNMSYSKRKFLLDLRNGGQLDAFSLDSAIRVCLVLLRDCFSRFTQTEECSKFLKEFTDSIV